MVDITKEAAFFWYKLETDLATCIPNYIKNGFKYVSFQLKLTSIIFVLKILITYYQFFSICGYDNALVFKSIEEDDITYVEEYIRNNLLKQLDIDDGNQAEGAQSEHQAIFEAEKIHFFGQYAKCPSKFEIHRGERKLIKAVVEYINKIVDSIEPNKCGLRYFSMMDNIKKGTIKSKTIDSIFLNSTMCCSAGRFFGKREQISTVKTTKPDVKRVIDDDQLLREDLFNKVKKLLNSIKDIDEPMFTIDMVSVQITTRGEVKGVVACPQCHKKNNTKKHTIQYNLSPSTYWILSNFKKHLNNHVKPNNRQIQLKNELSKVALALEDDAVKVEPGDVSSIVPANVYDIKSITEEQLQQVAYKVIANGDEKPEVGFIEDTDNVMGEIYENNDNLTATDDRETNEKLIYNQICDQNIKIGEAALSNNEAERSMAFNFDDNSTGTIKVVMIKKDGDCLFGALAHQLFFHKLNSKAHKTSTKKLRADVVEYIQANIGAFERYIKGRLYEMPDEEENTSDYFFKNCLARPGYWGGMESLKAVSEIFNVNILIFNQNGTFHSANDFNFEHERSIAIAFRNSAGQLNKKNNNNNIDRNHYDSVTQISQADIYKCMRELIKKHAQRNLYKKLCEKNEPVTLS